MKPILFITTAVISYLIASINSSIILSNAIFRKDIRTCGSGNPGFTNFKRNFGNKVALVVLFIDIFKAAIPVAASSYFFELYLGQWQFGAAYAGLFCMLGNGFPVWYKFKGGKGYLTYMGLMLFVDWRAWLAAVAVLGIVLFFTKYMSLSSMSSTVAGVATLFIVRADLYASIICTAITVFIIVRHKANIQRLIKGTESKFYFSKKKMK